MTPEGWEELLLRATEKVWRDTLELAAGADRGRLVGVGASGDKTILADKRAEDILLGELKEVGQFRVLSEEAGFVGGKSGTLAVVDPLDGSSNFEHGIPFYCTSVAIAEGPSIGDVVAGVVRDLVSGDAYSATMGGGARKNGRRIGSSPVSEMSEAVLGVDLSRGTEALVSGLSPLISGAKRQVHLGANALELCYVADGRIDGFVDIRGRIRVTDFAAAYLIAAEAGAEITDVEGSELQATFDLERRYSFVASGNLRLHKEILGLCRAWAGRKE